MTEWKPIATAPKNGRFLTYDPEFGVSMTEWHDKFVAIDNGGWDNLEPTHWMPLPEPPSH